MIRSSDQRFFSGTGPPVPYHSLSEIRNRSGPVWRKPLTDCITTQTWKGIWRIDT